MAIHAANISANTKWTYLQWQLSMKGLISAKRVSDFIESLSSGAVKPSKATVLAFQDELSGLLDKELETIRESVVESPVISVDETPRSSIKGLLMTTKPWRRPGASHSAYVYGHIVRTIQFTSQ